MKSDEELKKDFFELKNRKEIADLLEISDRSLRYFLYVRRPENLYTEFKIKKKSGTSRQIYAPCNELKTIQKKLAYILNLIYLPKVCVFGFVKGKNIKQNAEKHVKKQEILNIDLKDFFTQFHFGRVRGLFKSKPYSFNNEVATTIAQIVCYNGFLPQGAPTSPVITNMICSSFDNAMMKFAKKYRLTYTRYADDLSFSGYKNSIVNSIIFRDDDKWNLSSELQNIFHDNNLEINYDKLTIRGVNERHEITGIITNKFCNTKREYTKNVRAILHNCESSGIYDTALKYIEKHGCKNPKIIQAVELSNKEVVFDWFSKVIKGKINHIAQIKGFENFSYLTLAKKANDVFGIHFFDVSLLNDINTIIKSITFIIDNEDSETKNIRQGSAFYIDDYGIFTSNHVTDDGDFYKVFTESSYSDRKSIALLCDDNKIKCNNDIDYALYKIVIQEAVKVSIGDSLSLKVGDTVIVAGYPSMNRGDSVTIQTCKITGKTEHFGCLLYKIDGRIVHGYSGGIVLNTKKEVVGMVKAGIVSLSEDETTDKQGFVPIHFIIDDLTKKGEE